MAGNANLLQNGEYKSWLKALKQKVLHTQMKAAVKVNATLLQFYWELGEEIVLRQAQSSWGDGFLKQLSHDLMAEFPDMKGFSERNLKYIRQWFLFYANDKAIGQQAVAQLTQIPWGHNLKVISHCQSSKEAFYYVQNTLENGWSRSVLTHQMESGLIDADLGGGVVKKRIALPNRGKNGSVRTLIATNKNDRWFFVLGFEKNQRDNITEKELLFLKDFAADLLK